MNKKILVVSTQISGGCFQYADSLIKNFPTDTEIVIPQKVCEKTNVIPTWTIKFWGYNAVSRYVSFGASLLRILYGLIFHRYKALLLFGITKWDYYYLKLWRKFGLPSFVVIHDGKLHKGEFDKSFQDDVVTMMTDSKHLVFLSNYVRELVKQNFGIDKPSVIAPHGLIDYGTLPEAEKISSKPNLLFLGRVSRYKGVEILLDAIKQVPEDLYDKLIIAGKWSYPPPVAYDKSKVKIVDKWLSNDEILHYISVSDIMVFPYIEATQSGVATLAINYLKPSVVTRVGALPEQFYENAVVFTSPSSSAFADGIIRILQNSEKFEYCKNAMQNLKQNFEWQTIASELIKYINQNS